jgi:hypothetical protein
VFRGDSNREALGHDDVSVREVPGFAQQGEALRVSLAFTHRVDVTSAGFGEVGLGFLDEGAPDPFTAAQGATATW